MISLAGLSPKEVEDLISPLPSFRAKQIYKWIIRGVYEFDKMTDIPAGLQKDFNSRFKIFSSVIDSIHDDTDTKKIVITLHDGLKIEAVFLNDGKGRYTACLSTQAGCPAGCVFCKTGTLGFKRNLTSGEIIEQYLHLTGAGSRERGIDKTNSKSNPMFLDNIVIMGMGEPLLNLSELRKAILFFTDPDGLNISRRRITVSTCGIYKSLFELAEKGPYIRLALSLTTACEKLRQRLMPVTKQNPLQKVKEALAAYQKKGGGRITLEIPLLSGINTRKEDAAAVSEFANGFECIINLIPWNPVSGLSFEGNPLVEPEKKEISDYKKFLEDLGLKVTTRYRKGRNVNGACGQLGVISN